MTAVGIDSKLAEFRSVIQFYFMERRGQNGQAWKKKNNYFLKNPGLNQETD